MKNYFVYFILSLIIVNTILCLSIMVTGIATYNFDYAFAGFIFSVAMLFVIAKIVFEVIESIKKGDNY